MFGIAGIIKSPLQRFRGLSVGIVIFIILIFLYINAGYVYGQYVEQVTFIMGLYFMMLLMALAYTKGHPATLGSNETWTNFIYGFVFTAVPLLFITIGVPYIFQVSSVLEFPLAAFSLAAFGFGALHGLVKAYIEEEVFRNLLPKAGKLGDVISNILFGAFHLAVLVTIRGYAITEIMLPVAVLVILGLGWAKMRNGFGIMGSTGSHFAWNIFAMGLLVNVLVPGVVA